MSEEKKIFDKKFVHFMWTDELKDKEGFFADCIDTIVNRVNNNITETVDEKYVFGSCTHGDNAYPFSLENAHYRFFYCDPLYEYKWAYNHGKKVEVYGFVGISRAWVEVTDDWKWKENYEYRIKPEKFTLIEPDCNDDKLRVLSEYTPVHVDEHAFVGTREECRNYAVEHFCNCCIHTDSPCVWDDCTGFIMKKESEDSCLENENVQLNEMAKNMYAVAKQRQENGASIKVDTVSMLKHTSTELVEATEAYSKVKYFPQLNLNEQEIEKEHFAGELADIIACVLIICAGENIDMEQALKDCYEKNRLRAEGKGDKK